MGIYDYNHRGRMAGNVSRILSKRAVRWAIDRWVFGGHGIGETAGAREQPEQPVLVWDAAHLKKIFLPTILAHGFKGVGLRLFHTIALVLC